MQFFDYAHRYLKNYHAQLITAKLSQESLKQAVGAIEREIS